MLKKLPIIGLFVLSSSLPVQAFDLMDALLAAQQHDAKYAAAGSANLAGQEAVQQGWAAILPKVSLNAAYSQQEGVEPRPSNTNVARYGVGLTQPLFDVRAYTSFKKGQLGTRLADVVYNREQQQFIFSVSEAYFKVLLADNTLATTLAAKKAYERELAFAKDAFDAGTATIVDTYEAQSGFDSAVAKQISGENQLAVAKNELQQLTGLNPDEITGLQQEVPLTNPEPNDVQVWIARAWQNSPIVANSALQLAAAEQDALAAKGQFLPTVALTGNYDASRSEDRNVSANGINDTRGNSIGVTLSVPIFAGGGIRSGLREALAKEEQAKFLLEASRRDAQIQVTAAFLAMTNGGALVKANQRLVQSAKSKLEATTLGRDVGVRTSLDLLNAERGYYEAKQALAETIYVYLKAKLNLHQQVGGLNTNVLQEMNAFFIKPATLKK